MENAPYKLPKGWMWIKLNTIVKTEKGKKPKKLTKENIRNNLLPYLTADYFRRGTLKAFAEDYEKVRLISNGSLVLIWDGSKAGDIFISDIDGVLASTMVKLIIKYNKIYPKFIYFIIKHYFPVLNSRTTGSGIPHVSKIIFNNLLFPIPFKKGKPDLEKQKEIVERIEEIFERIKKAEELRKRSLQKTKLIFNSALNKIFESVKEDGWKEVEFKNIGDIIRGVNFKKTESVSVKRGNFIPVITASNIIGDVLVKEKLIYVPLKESKPEQRIKKNDTIIVMSTGSKKALGRVYFSKNNEDVFIGAFLGIIRTYSHYYPRFFCYFMLTHNFRRHLLSYTGSQINNIGIGKFKNLKVPIPFKDGKPDIEKQKEIAEYLDKLNDKIKQLEELQNREMIKFSKLKNSVLNKAFRGELI